MEMPSADVCRATSAILHSLAKGEPQYAAEELRIVIPGEDTAERKDLEKELRALVHRVRQLEARAASANNQTFPETPNENAIPSSPFSLSSIGSHRHPSPVPIKSGHIPTRDGLHSSSPGSDVSDQSHLEFLQQKCKSHEQEIQENRKKLKDLMDETEKVKQAPMVPMDEASKIERLQRELKKSQQANEAFSKALREIGEIVTAGMRFENLEVLGK